MREFAFYFGFLHLVFEVLVSADYVADLSGFNYFLCFLFACIARMPIISLIPREGPMGYSLFEKQKLGLLTYKAGTFSGEMLRVIIQYLQYPLHIGSVLAVMGLIQVWKLLWWQAVGLVFIIPIIHVSFLCITYITMVILKK